MTSISALRPNAPVAVGRAEASTAEGTTTGFDELVDSLLPADRSAATRANDTARSDRNDAPGNGTALSDEVRQAGQVDHERQSERPDAEGHRADASAERAAHKSRATGRARLESRRTDGPGAADRADRADGADSTIAADEATDRTADDDATDEPTTAALAAPTEVLAAVVAVSTPVEVQADLAVTIDLATTEPTLTVDATVAAASNAPAPEVATELPITDGSTVGTGVGPDGGSDVAPITEATVTTLTEATVDGQAPAAPTTATGAIADSAVITRTDATPDRTEVAALADGDRPVGTTVHASDETPDAPTDADTTDVGAHGSEVATSISSNAHPAEARTAATTSAASGTDAIATPSTDAVAAAVSATTSAARTTGADTATTTGATPGNDIAALAGTATAAPTTTAPTVAGSPRPAAGPAVPVEAMPVRIVSALRPLRGRDGSHSMSLDLDPMDLGRVRVDVTVERGVVHIALRAESGSTSKLLESQLSDLRAALEDAGLTAGDLGVGADAAGGRSGDDVGARRTDRDDRNGIATESTAPADASRGTRRAGATPSSLDLVL